MKSRAEASGDVVVAAAGGGDGGAGQVAEGDQPGEQPAGDRDLDAEVERVERQQGADDRRAERVERDRDRGVERLGGVDRGVERVPATADHVHNQRQEEAKQACGEVTRHRGRPGAEAWRGRVGVRRAGLRGDGDRDWPVLGWGVLARAVGVTCSWTHIGLLPTVGIRVILVTLRT